MYTRGHHRRPRGCHVSPSASHAASAALCFHANTLQDEGPGPHTRGGRPPPLLLRHGGQRRLGRRNSCRQGAVTLETQMLCTAGDFWRGDGEQRTRRSASRAWAGSPWPLSSDASAFTDRTARPSPTRHLGGTRESTSERRGRESRYNTSVVGDKPTPRGALISGVGWRGRRSGTSLARPIAVPRHAAQVLITRRSTRHFVGVAWGWGAHGGAPRGPGWLSAARRLLN